MTASALFSAFSMMALGGWLVLAAGLVFNKPFLRERIAGLWIPVLLSGAYTGLILLFFTSSPGGFDTLENVQRLFTSPWAALAGWVHYLAFDLFMGGENCPRK